MRRKLVLGVLAGWLLGLVTASLAGEALYEYKLVEYKELGSGNRTLVGDWQVERSYPLSALVAVRRLKDPLRPTATPLPTPVRPPARLAPAISTPTPIT